MVELRTPKEAAAKLKVTEDQVKPTGMMDSVGGGRLLT